MIAYELIDPVMANLNNLRPLTGILQAGRSDNSAAAGDTYQLYSASRTQRTLQEIPETYLVYSSDPTRMPGARKRTYQEMSSEEDAGAAAPRVGRVVGVARATVSGSKRCRLELTQSTTVSSSSLRESWR